MAMSGGTERLVKTSKANYGKDGDINLYVYYKSTQDTANNKSTVYCGMYVKTPSTSYDIGSWTDSRGSYVGTTSNTFNGTIPNFAGTRWLVENKSFTVNHDSEGKATATIYWKWGVNSPWGGYEVPSGSFTITLPQIARASTISSVHSGIDFGTSTKITWQPKSSSFYYKVRLSLGSWNNTSAALYPGSTKDYTYTATIPYEAINQLSSGATSGNVTATLYTYSDKACSKQVGDADVSNDIYVHVPDNDTTKPTVNMTLSPVNVTGKEWSGLYVQGLSRVKATFAGSGKYGATVSSYKMNVNGKDYSSPYTSPVLNADGSYTVTGYATDSRGNTGIERESITVIPYGKPRILPHSDEREIVCGRCNSNGTLNESGTHLRIKAMRSYSKIMSGSKQCNFCDFSYRLKESGDNYSSWKSILGRGNAETDSVDVTLDSEDEVYLEPTVSYSVQLRLLDDVGKEHIETFVVPTIDVDFNLKEGGGGAAFGKYAERDNAVELADDWDLVMKGEVVADFVIEQGTSGIWSYRKWNSGRCELYGCHQAKVAIDQQVGGVCYSGTIRVDLPFTVYDMTTIVDCNDVYIWASTITSAASEGANSMIYLLVRGATQPATKEWTSYIHTTGRWK